MKKKNLDWDSLGRWFNISAYNFIDCDHAFATDIPDGPMGGVDGLGASDAVPLTRDGVRCHTGGLTLSLVCKSTANSTSR